jgi:hypothetical protein
MAGTAAAPAIRRQVAGLGDESTGNVNPHRKNTEDRIGDGPAEADFLNRILRFPSRRGYRHRMAARGYLFLDINGYVARPQDIDTPECS